MFRTGNYEYLDIAQLQLLRGIQNKMHIAIIYRCDDRDHVSNSFHGDGLNPKHAFQAIQQSLRFCQRSLILLGHSLAFRHLLGQVLDGLHKDINI